jgi:hypothetical protein
MFKHSSIYLKKRKGSLSAHSSPLHRGTRRALSVQSEHEAETGVDAGDKG